MKKLSLANVGLVSMSVLALGATPVFASEEQPVAVTEGTVQFKVDDETKPPVTPPTDNGNGGGTIDPTKPDTDGESGDGKPSFNITHVSNFRFNEKESFNADTQTWKWSPINLNANGMTLYAYGTDLALYRQNDEGKWIDKNGDIVEKETDAQRLAYKDLPNFIQVTDNRGNKKAGWKLEVARTQFTDGTDELAGATISLNNAFIKGPDGVSEPTYSTEEVEIPLASDGGSAVVMEAVPGAGIGSWSLSFGDVGESAIVAGTEDEATPVTYGQLALVNEKPKSGVKLVVPASAQAQTDVVYKSAITWTLSSVPEA